AQFNARLLSRWSASWWQPPVSVTGPMVDEFADLFEDASARFAAAFGSEGDWVWKDPRLTVLLPVWERVLGKQAVLLPYRLPQAVAHSIAWRDDLTYEQGLAIWERHTRLALTCLAGRRVAVTDYAQLQADPAQWQAQLLSFCRAAGLSVSEPHEPAEAQ